MTREQLAIKKSNTMAILSVTFSSLPIHTVLIFDINETFHCSYYVDHTDDNSKIETFNKILELDAELLYRDIIWSYNIEWDEESDTCKLSLYYMSPQLDE